MSFADLEKILIVSVFLGGLLGVRFYIQRFANGKALPGGAHKRIRIGEVAALSSRDKVMIVAVDDQEYMVVTGKAGVNAVHPLHNSQAAA